MKIVTLCALVDSDGENTIHVPPNTCISRTQEQLDDMPPLTWREFNKETDNHVENHGVVETPAYRLKTEMDKLPAGSPRAAIEARKKSNAAVAAASAKAAPAPSDKKSDSVV